MGTQQLPGQSSSVVQFSKQEKLTLLSNVRHVEPLQQSGVSSPAQAAPTLPQPQNLASTQNPSVLSVNNWQQPVSKQSSFLLQFGRHPPKFGFSESTQPPRQHGVGLFGSPGSHGCSPWTLQAV